MKYKHITVLLIMLSVLTAVATPEPTPTHLTIANERPRMAVPMLAVKAKRKPHVFHADKSVVEIPAEELNEYQKKSIEEAKKVLPPNETNITDTKVYQTPLGLWMTITVSENSGDYFERYEFLKKSEKKPILFFEHERAIDLISSHHGRFLLVNNFEAVGGCKVVMVDLMIGKKWPIDIQPEKNYLKQHSRHRFETHSQRQCFTAVGISPEDKKVLLQSMDMQFGQPNHEYKPWFYVVDAISGNILEIYKTAQESFAVYNENWKSGL